MKKRALIFGAICLLLAFPASATLYFRCGSNLVSTGATMGEVMMKCGEPMMKNIDTTGSGNVKSETWYYNCGQGQFNHILVFVGMKLIRIVRTDERGTGLADWQKN